VIWASGEDPAGTQPVNPWYQDAIRRWFLLDYDTTKKIGKIAKFFPADAAAYPAARQ
jgi:hypothetical protein